MKIIIIEDEQLTADDLKDILLEIAKENEIVKILNSVEESIDFFSEPQDVDLIFSDIQLGDGLSFDIFKSIQPQAPIVFCTAYDEYALEAFETNGIHYVLKPFNAKKIEESLEKFELLKSNFQPSAIDKDLQEVVSFLKTKKKEYSTILVSKKDRIIPIEIIDIAVIYIDTGISYVLTFNQNKYRLDDTLNNIQFTLGNDFYRANRQFIVNRKAIKEVGESLSRKSMVYLKVPFDEEILISKERKIEFLNWLRT